MSKLGNTIFVGATALTASAIGSTLAFQNNTVHADTTNANSTASQTTKSKTVKLVDETGKQLATGTITETDTPNANGGTSKSFSLSKSIPDGYELKDTHDLSQYPDTITLVKKGSQATSTTNTDANKGSQSTNQTTPATNTDVNKGGQNTSQTTSTTNTDSNKADKNNATGGTLVEVKATPSADPWADKTAPTSTNISSTAKVKSGDSTNNIFDFKANGNALSNIGRIGYAGEGDETLVTTIKGKDGKTYTLTRTVNVGNNNTSSSSDENTPVAHRVELPDVTIKQHSDYTPFVTQAKTSAGSKDLAAKVTMNGIGTYRMTWRFGDTGFEQLVTVKPVANDTANDSNANNKGTTDNKSTSNTDNNSGQSTSTVDPNTNNGSTTANDSNNKGSNANSTTSNTENNSRQSTSTVDPNANSGSTASNASNNKGSNAVSTTSNTDSTSNKQSTSADSTEKKGADTSTTAKADKSKADNKDKSNANSTNGKTGASELVKGNVSDNRNATKSSENVANAISKGTTKSSNSNGSNSDVKSSPSADNGTSNVKSDQAQSAAASSDGQSQLPQTGVEHSGETNVMLASGVATALAAGVGLAIAGKKKRI